MKNKHGNQKLQNQWWSAVENSELHNISRLLKDKHVDVNARKQPYNGTALLFAAQKGMTEIVRILLQAGADVNLSDRGSWTPLHWAAQKGHLDIVKMLCEGVPSGSTNRAEIETKVTKNSDGATALHLAVQEGNVDVVVYLLTKNPNLEAERDCGSIKGLTALHIAVIGEKPTPVLELYSGRACADPKMGKGSITRRLELERREKFNRIIIHLLSKGANVNAANSLGQTPLYIAAQNNEVGLVALFLRQGAAVDAVTHRGHTALHMAAQNGHQEVVALLLKHNANTSLKDKQGYTALSFANSFSHVQISKMLLGKEVGENDSRLREAAAAGDSEAVLQLVKSGVNVQAQDQNGATALHFAALNGNGRVIQILCEHGADVNAQENSGSTPLHLAAFRDCVMAIKMLLAQPKIDKELKNNKSATALHVAVANNHVEVVRALLEGKANVNCKNDDGWTPLHAAAQEGKVEMVELLLENGAEVKHNGWTPLHLAARRGQGRVVEILLKKGSDVNASGPDAETPLYLAAKNNYSAVVELLLNEGADPKITIWESTAFHIAVKQGHLDVIKIFLGRGFDINYQVKETGKAALHFAIEAWRKDVIDFLLAHSADIYLKDNYGESALSFAQLMPCNFQNVITCPTKRKLDRIKKNLESLSQPSQETLHANGKATLLFPNERDAIYYFEALCICYQDVSDIVVYGKSIDLNVFLLEPRVSDEIDAKSRVASIKKGCDKVFKILKNLGMVQNYQIGLTGISYVIHNREILTALSQLDVFKQYSLEIDSEIEGIRFPLSLFLDKEKFNFFMSVLEKELKNKVKSPAPEKNGNVQTKQTEREKRILQLAYEEQKKKEEEIANRKKTEAEKLAHKQEKAEALARQKAEEAALALGRATALALEKAERAEALARNRSEKVTPFTPAENQAAIVLAAEKKGVANSGKEELKPDTQISLADVGLFSVPNKKNKNQKKREKRKEKTIQEPQKIRLWGLDVEGLNEASRFIKELIKKEGETIFEYNLCLLSDLKAGEKMKENTVYLSEATRQCRFIDTQAKEHTVILPMEIDLSNLGSKLNNATLKWQLSEFMLASGYSMGFWDVAMQRHIFHGIIGIIYIFDIIRSVNDPQAFTDIRRQLISIRNQLAHECALFDEQGQPAQLVLYSKAQLVAMGEAIAVFKAFADESELLKEAKQLISVFQENKGIILEIESEKLREAHLRRSRINLWRLKENKDALEKQALLDNEESDFPIDPKFLNSAIVMLYCKIGEAHSKAPSSRQVFTHCRQVRNHEYHQDSSQSSQGIERYVANQYENIFSGVEALLKGTNFSTLTRLEKVEILSSSSFFSTSSSTSSSSSTCMELAPKGLEK